jgi:hypothetical protein
VKEIDILIYYKRRGIFHALKFRKPNFNAPNNNKLIIRMRRRRRRRIICYDENFLKITVSFEENLLKINWFVTIANNKITCTFLLSRSS